MNGFSASGSIEVSLNGIVYDFTVNHDSFEKPKILIIHKYLMTSNNMK